MRPVGSSFLSLQLASQPSIRLNQSALAKAQVELSTQRHQDVLGTLSGQTGRNIRWHAELSTVDRNTQANNLHRTRAEVTQNSLTAATELASEFAANLIAARGADGGPDIIADQAKNALAMLGSLLNTEIDGSYLFAGRNPTMAPIRDYYGEASELQFDARFFSEFGMSKVDPAVKNITPGQIETFLNGNFNSMFEPPNWQANVSNASSENISAYIGMGQSVDVTVSANEAPVRQLYAALVGVAEMASGDINDASFKKLMDVAASKVSSVVQGLADIQSRIGINQKSLEDATNQLKVRKTWIGEVILKTESVDTYEVATRINGLISQLEASYSVTSRISRISLLNYL